MEQAAQTTPRTRSPWWASLVFSLIVVVGVGGFFHVLYDGNGGCEAPFKVCSKESWSIGDTFIDRHDYTGKRGHERFRDKAAVFRALSKCEP